MIEQIEICKLLIVLLLTHYLVRDKKPIRKFDTNQ